MKNELDAIFRTFESYIRQNDYFDILYSEKFGYIRLAEINSISPEIETLDTPRKMLDALFNDLINDVVFSPNNPQKDPYRFILTEYDQAEIRRRFAAILETVENEEDRDCYTSLLDSYLSAYHEDNLRAWVDGN